MTTTNQNQKTPVGRLAIDALKNICEPDSFKAQYADERWRQCARSHVRANSHCHSCRRSDVVLHAHHVNYEFGKKLWEAEQGDLVTLCDDCHKQIGNAIKAFRRIASFCNAPTAIRIAAILQTMIQQHGDISTARALMNALERNNR